MGNSSNKSKLEKWTKECNSKWSKVKEELKIKVEQWPRNIEDVKCVDDFQNHKHNWPEVVGDWINETKLLTRLIMIGNVPFLFLTFVFPQELNAETSAKSSDSFEMEIFTESGKSAFSDHTTTFNFADRGPVALYSLDVVDFTRYRDLITSIKSVPINLLGDVIHHIALAFGGSMKYSDSKAFMLKFSSFTNCLHYEKQHQFPGCSFVKVEYQVQESISAGREWREVKCSSIIVGGELFSSPSHRDELFVNLSRHQCSRFIDYHFNGGNISNNTKIKTAHDFVASLILHSFSIGDYRSIRNRAPTYQIDIAYSTINSRVAKPLLLVFGKTMEQLLNFTIQADANIKKQMIHFADALTIQDIDDILHIFVEVYCGNEQLRQRVLEQDRRCEEGTLNPADKFPTLNDHFESFDEPLLRGFLTQTSAARKLVRHTRELEQLRKQSAASDNFVPKVVSALIESYFTPLL